MTTPGQSVQAASGGQALVMRAVRYHRGKPGVRCEQAPVGQPGPGEVLVQVQAAGLCGTDVHVAYGTGAKMISKPVITLGHEMAGVIAALGGDVGDWSVGDPVVAAPIVPCGRCPYCDRGAIQLCDSATVYGLGRDGSFAEYVIAPVTSLIALPAGIPKRIGAIVTDAVATPYHALFERAGLSPGESVAVFGVGGLGQHAIQLARLVGAARIIAVDVREEQLEFALQNGADAVVDGRGEDLPRALRRANGGRGVDLAAEFVGRATSIQSAFASITKGGRLVVVGLGPEPLALPASDAFAMREVSLIGSGGFRKDTVARLLTLVSSGRLSLESSISHVVGLDEVDGALRMLRDRTESTRRIVVLP